MAELAMSSAAGPVVYWCHQCNVETRPAVGEDVLCTFCNQGFIEELHNTEVEPGVVFSTLPLPFSSLLRRPSPTSIGVTRDRSITDSPSSSPQAEQPQQENPFGRNQSDPQGHRPRILSGQLSGVPSLLEAMMQVLEEINGPLPPASRSASGRLDADPTSRGASGHEHHGSEEAGADSSRMDEARPQTPGQIHEGETHALLFPPTLILHGDSPNGFRTLEVFIDHGQGMGPQMMPNHMRDYFFGPDLDRLIQLLAENDPNRYGTPPAAKSEVEKLPKFKITEEHLRSELSQCAVCKDDFELDAEVRQMPCKHIYHPDCILPWLAEHNSCPICRFELPTDDTDYEARKGQSRSGDANANTTERQGSGAHGGPNNTESGTRPLGGEGASDNENGGSRQFTLWGMPALGFDMTRGLNPFTRTEEHGRQPESGQEQGASREGGTRDGAPVQWLFRLFSSGSLSAGDNTSSVDQSPSRGSERGDSSP